MFYLYFECKSTKYSINLQLFCDKFSRNVIFLRISAVLRHYFTILWVLFRSCAVPFSGLQIRNSYLYGGGLQIRRNWFFFAFSYQKSFFSFLRRYLKRIANPK